MVARDVAYFNANVKGNGTKRLSSYFTFMQPESSDAARVVKLRLQNTAYKMLHT